MHTNLKQYTNLLHAQQNEIFHPETKTFHLVVNQFMIQRSEGKDRIESICDEWSKRETL